MPDDKSGCHAFDKEDARMYGINEAIILYNIKFWISENKKKNINLKAGRYWTYNTIKTYSEVFYYMTIDQIRRAFDHLVEKNVLLCDNFNKHGYDKTKWYTLNNANSIWHLCQMDSLFERNGIVKNHKPIPDINKNINSLIKKEINPDDYDNDEDFIEATSLADRPF